MRPGTRHTSEARKKISTSVKHSWENATQRRLILVAKNSARRGWHQTEEVKAKIVAARKQQWIDHRGRMMRGPKASMKSAARKPNGIERRVWLVLNKRQPGMWIYSGGGPSARRVNGYYPDFLSELQKKIVEVDGVPWHKDRKRDLERNKAYRRVGYHVLAFRYTGRNEGLLMQKLEVFCG